jgi:hypothetical protein
MAIKIKHRDPRSTDFSPKDIVVNVKEGTLFYKSDTSIFKIQGDDLNTLNTEVTHDFLNLSSSIIITGSITPKNDIFNLGNSTNKWKEIVATTGSFDLIVFDGGSF